MEEAKIDYILKMATAFVTLCFILSYSYHFGFLTRLGLFFNDVPISIFDISKTALASMPVVLLYGVLPMAFGMLGPILAHTGIFGIIPNMPEYVSKTHKKPWFLIFTVVISQLVGFFSWLMYSSMGFLFYLCACIFTGILFARFASKVGLVKLSLYLSIPLLVAMSVDVGENRASSLMKASPSYIIVFATGDEKVTTLLGTYEAGILTFDNGHTHFTKWDAIKGITYKKPDPDPSILCGWDKAIKEIEIPACVGR